MSATWKEKMAQRCRHIEAYPAKICKAGVEYDSLPKPHPCIPRGETKTECDCFALWTAEEIEEKERKNNEFVENMIKARAAIVEHIGTERKKQFIRGRIDCPVCGNLTLGFSYAGNYNGHIHAACSTDGCICWME